MAFSWFVYTTLGPRDALALEDRLRAALDDLLKAQPTLRRGQEWGDITVEEAIPSVDDVIELSEAFGRPVSDDVLDRLETCRTAFSVERAGVHDLDALQVSILEFLLDNVGPCLIDWGDMQIVLSEDVRKELGEYTSAGSLERRNVAQPDPELTEEVEPATDEDLGGREPTAEVGLRRSAATERAIAAVAEDPFLSRKFVRALEQLPDFVQRYAEIIGEKGAMADARAAEVLGMSRDELEPGLKKLHDVATGLAEDLEED